MSDSDPDAHWPQPEDNEYEHALSSSTSRLLRARRPFVPIVILVVVFGIAASLIAIGISRDEQLETKPPEKEVATQLTQPNISPEASVEPPQIPGSLVLDATKSYLASPGGNSQPATEAERLQLCLFIEDGYKQRLDCYDKIFPPDPKLKPPTAKLVADCKFLKEEDQRLACFNRFVAPPSKPPQKSPAKARLNRG